jgi:hypothetical protein
VDAPLPHLIYSPIASSETPKKMKKTIEDTVTKYLGTALETASEGA